MLAPRLGRKLIVSLLGVLLSSAAAHVASSADLDGLYKRGRYDAVIEAATEQLKSPIVDPKVHYLRGRAYYGIGWFSEAEADLAPLGGFSPHPLWPRAAEIVAKIAEMRRLSPSEVEEVKSGDRLLFRVYYDDDDAWTRALIESLPDAHRQVGGFYGAGVSEIPVFVFRNAERYRAFVEAWSGKPPPSWNGAMGGAGVLLFYKRGKGGIEQLGLRPVGLRATVFHEYSHAVCRRAFGNSLPTWLREGLAQVCGALASPGATQRNQKDVLRIADEDGWLPLASLQGRDQFREDDTHRVAYIQAFAMTRYLMGEWGKPKLLELLNSLADKSSPDLAFPEVLGVSQAQFYEAWRYAPS